MNKTSVEKAMIMGPEMFARLFYYRRDTDFQAALYMMILLGLDAQQVSGARWADLDFSAGALKLPDGRTLKITPDVLAFFRSFRRKKLEDFFERGNLDGFRYIYCKADGTKFSPQEISADFSAYLGENGYEGFSQEEIRRSFPEYLYEKDMITKILHMYRINSRIKEKG